MTTASKTLLALACLVLLLSCEQPVQPQSNRDLQHVTWPSAGEDGTEPEPRAAPPLDPMPRSEVRLCPANNLTQPCTCDDGGGGRQICIETRGWSACDCGQQSIMDDMSGALNAAPEDPPANHDVGVMFEDFVMPRLTNAADCQPGRYVGTFECNYQGMFQAMGVVSFVLERGASAEVLQIRDGLLDGWGGAFFFAYLNGDLDCLSGELSGTADDGFYNPLLKGCSGQTDDDPGVNCVITDPSDPGYVPWTVNLSGSYAATLEPTTATLTGTWALSPLDLGGVCDGSFEVTLEP